MNAAGVLGAITAEDGNGLVWLESAGEDLTDAEAAKVWVDINGRDHRLQAVFVLTGYLRGGNVVNNGLEQRNQGLARSCIPVEGCLAIECRRVDNREVQLLIGCTQFGKEVECLIDHPVRARIGAVHFVDNNDDFMTGLKGLFENEAGLWHRAIDSIHEEEDAINNQHHALNFAAKVSVARGIDNIDLDTRILNGGVLGDDGDTALTLLIHTVHDALSDFLVITEGASLLEHAVQQGRFPVVNVGNDGDIAEHFIPLMR